MNENPVRTLDKVIAIDQDLCLVCGACVGACPANAMSLDSTSLHILRELCTMCERCVELCPVTALSVKVVTP